MKTTPSYYIFIDLENLPHLSLEEFEASECTIFIFIGAKQAKIPDELVEKTEKIAGDTHWIRMAKSGKNNLDFHLTFQLGRCHEQAPSEVNFIIMSDDTGFDPIVSYINQLGRVCKRMAPFPLNQEIFTGQEAEIEMVKNELWLKNATKRPANKNKLINHIDHFAKHKKLQTSTEILIQELIREGCISLNGHKVEYHI